MTRDEIISSINDTVDEAIATMSESIPKTQRKVLEEVEQLVRDLDYSGKNIKVNVKNLRVIGAITNKLRRIIMDADYKENVVKYMRAFGEITTLQNAYLKQTTSDFKVAPVLAEIKDQSIQSTIQGLTEQGLTSNVIDSIQDVLRTNITSGGTYNQITEELRNTIVGKNGSVGIIERYLSTYTTDAISQYSRNYLQTATDGLGMNWFSYSGSNKETSRCFCLAMTKKRYFHRTEIPDLLDGNFKEWQDMDCKMYDRTGLPEGMIAGTNVANFLTNLGGYNCTHRALPIPARLVPEDVKGRVYAKYPSARPKKSAMSV